MQFGCTTNLSKTWILVVVGLIGLIANIIIFQHYNPDFGRILKVVQDSDSAKGGTKTKAENFASYYRANMPSSILHNHGELLHSVQKVVANLQAEMKARPQILAILRGIVPILNTTEDVATLITLLEQTQKDINLSDSKPGLISATSISDVSQIRLPPCPKNPPNLLGIVTINQTTILPEQLENNYSQMEMGGHYRPGHCVPKQRLAIIIPFRNRHKHLYVLLSNLLPVLMRQQLDFTIFVIEQDLPTTFNRGMLFNIGYLEALKLDKFDCFIFHDVDMIPVNDHCLYQCSQTGPRHMTSAINKWNYRLPYESYFGGVIAFTREQLKNINGNSNLYFGWGGEDDDLLSRVRRRGYKILRYPVDIGRYDTISHVRDKGNNPNPDRFKLVDSAGERQMLEGLNTTVYKVSNIQFKRLYTWINVFINMTQVLQTAPPGIRKDIDDLLNQSQTF